MDWTKYKERYKEAWLLSRDNEVNIAYKKSGSMKGLCSQFALKEKLTCCCSTGRK